MVLDERDKTMDKNVLRLDKILPLPLLLMRFTSIVSKHITLETLHMVKDLISLIRRI